MRKHAIFLIAALGLWISGFLPAEIPVQAANGSGHVASPRQPDVKLPLLEKSVRFAVIGDSGTGDRDQYDVAQQMEIYRQATKFDFVIMLGDNIYGSHQPRDFEKKFSEPYKPLLDAGVKFYASLGNHDDPDDERLYKPFNMGGERYYAFRKAEVAFFALDSNYMDPKQLDWLDANLISSQGKWKICFFHHPLYNDGRHHGPDLDLRNRLLPMFERDQAAKFSLRLPARAPALSVSPRARPAPAAEPQVARA